MGKADDAAARARSKAQELLSRSKQQENERLATRTKEREAEAVKTARLRALRLAKEAADAAEKRAAKPRRKPGA